MSIKTKETAYDGYFKINKVVIEQSNGNEVNREQFELHDAVAGLVYNTTNDTFIFVKQFRIGPEKILLEIPAGKRDVDGEEPEDTLRREIMEEIGYKVDAINFLYEYYPAPGSSTETIQLFYVEVSEKVEEGGGIETEEIEIMEIPSSQIQDLLNKDSEIACADGKSIIAVQSLMISALVKERQIFFEKNAE